MHPWPTAFTFIKTQDDKPPVRMTIHSATCDKTETESEPGTIIECSENGITVATGRGVLIVKELQLAGKKRMPVTDFICGTQVPTNSRCING